jgi:hypothetical protein
LNLQSRDGLIDTFRPNFDEYHQNFAGICISIHSSLSLTFSLSPLSPSSPSSILIFLLPHSFSSILTIAPSPVAPAVRTWALASGRSSPPCCPAPPKSRQPPPRSYPPRRSPPSTPATFVLASSYALYCPSRSEFPHTGAHTRSVPGPLFQEHVPQSYPSAGRYRFSTRSQPQTHTPYTSPILRCITRFSLSREVAGKSGQAEEGRGHGGRVRDGGRGHQLLAAHRRLAPRTRRRAAAGGAAAQGAAAAAANVARSEVVIWPYDRLFYSLLSAPFFFHPPYPSVPLSLSLSVCWTNSL